MAKLAGEGMAVMEPLPRRDAPSCRGAIFCARTFNTLSDSGIQHGGGIEGRAQNIAPLQLIRCLIVECGGMEPCVPTCEWLATTDPPRLTAPASLSPSCASGSAFRLHGEIHNTPSPMAGLLLASLSQMAALPLAAI